MQILVVAAANIYFSPASPHLLFPCAIFPFKHFLGSYLLPVFKTARRKLKLISFSFSEKHSARDKKWTLLKKGEVKLLKNLGKIKHLLIVLRSMKELPKHMAEKELCLIINFTLCVCGGFGGGGIVSSKGWSCLSFSIT